MTHLKFFLRAPALLAMAASFVLTGSALADDLALAQKLATNHCAVCHTFDKGGPPGQGPNLFGLLGRKAASETNFTYSDGFTKAMAGKVWDEPMLDAWLTDAQSVAPGSAMVYSQDDPAKRQKIISYIKSLH
ncbi:c-type cytochrome [Pseudomonas umsongensis]|uniref:C-type cytochrome n=1 Tax=Pseudomonas umsongensis TaxID=198618 RepID=A0AAE6ZVQ9_9PSED|nr:c-type cytochrome [Pseudomonas umsongensis]QJC79713.1 c-type cytochrome [Pseudomonas umsongensis]